MKVGRWDHVAERLSRWARIELLNVLLSCGMRKGEVAELCSVTPAAVSHWASDPKYHPGNDATVELLQEAWKRNQETTTKILRTDAERFVHDLKEIGVKFTGV